MAKKPPIKHADVVRGLKALGFSQRPNKATSHTQWVKDTNVNGKPHRYKVTLDEHNAPYSSELIKSMAKQAGTTERGFRRLCTKAGAKKAKQGILGWLFN